MNQQLVIIGGGAGGPSSAAEAKRRNPDLSVTVLEQGPHVSYVA
jgi:glycine/D-amino acid oxidase-like deaminating enzyme